MRDARAKLVLCCLMLAAPLPSLSMAQDAPAVVPDPPVREQVCYSANQPIFVSYQFVFCLNRPGSYSANGGEITCEGRMSWRPAGRSVLANMHPASCGGGIAFEGAQMDCRPAGSAPAEQDAALPEQQLHCLLYPSNPTQKRQVFDASLKTEL